MQYCILFTMYCICPLKGPLNPNTLFQLKFCASLPLATFLLLLPATLYPLLPFHSPSSSAPIFSFPISHSPPLSLSLFLFGIWKSPRHPREEELMLHNVLFPHRHSLLLHMMESCPPLASFFPPFLPHTTTAFTAVLLVRSKRFVLKLPLGEVGSLLHKYIQWGRKKTFQCSIYTR